MKGDASFSACGRWRWWLTRVWDDALPIAALIGMNPSTATATENDPTVNKEINFVRSWGFGGLLKLNAYAFKATDPNDLYYARMAGVDVVGEKNTAGHMLDLLREFNVRRTVACWGRLRTDRGWILKTCLSAYGVQLDCFKKNADGSPAHPLYLPYGIVTQPWNY
jgi:hypothetical protein